MSRVPQRSLDPLSASPVRKNACLVCVCVGGGYSRSRTAPSCPRMIGHIAAAVRIPIESCGVIPESDARGVCERERRGEERGGNNRFAVWK